MLIENWHTLMPLKEPDRSVVKKGAESDEAFTRRVLGKLAAHKDIIVINDEAHHAYRKPADVKISKATAEALGHRPGRGHALDRGAGPHPQDAAHPALLRPVGHALRADREEPTPKHGAVRLDRLGLRPERRDRGRAGEDAARRGARRRAARRARRCARSCTTCTAIPRSPKT